MRLALRCLCRGSICQTAVGVAVIRLFRCAGCQALVPWCRAQDDDMPSHCDDCWAKTPAIVYDDRAEEAS